MTTETQLTHPSEIPLLADCYHVLSGGWSANGFIGRYVNPLGSTDKDETVFGSYCAHGSGSNLLFADKHVAWSAWEQIRKTKSGGPLRFERTEW